MYRVKIIGAGSIGNHLAHGCRSLDWTVTMVDTDPEALRRTRESIFPSRYGGWDTTIRLAVPQEVLDEKSDLVIIGTPPDSHVKIALDVLKNKPPRVVLIEKPLCPPSCQNCDELREAAGKARTIICVGYNHTLNAHTAKAGELMRAGWIGKPLTIRAAFREHWGGIFAAHPWLKGPADTYLGFSHRGGGASSEHSHAINLWQHLARLTGAGKIVEVSAMLDMVKEGAAEYDRICQIHARTESGLAGTIVQDVITKPSEKFARIQGADGFIEWRLNAQAAVDLLVWGRSNGERQEQYFPKSRPDDFRGEILHVKQLLDKSVKETDSPISLDRALETMRVLAATHRSHETGRRVRIHHDCRMDGAFLE